MIGSRGWSQDHQRGCQDRESLAAATVLGGRSVNRKGREAFPIQEGVRVCRKANAKTASEHLTPSLIPRFDAFLMEEGARRVDVRAPLSRYAFPRLCTYVPTLRFMAVHGNILWRGIFTPAAFLSLDAVTAPISDRSRHMSPRHRRRSRGLAVEDVRRSRNFRVNFSVP